MPQKPDYSSWETFDPYASWETFDPFKSTSTVDGWQTTRGYSPDDGLMTSGPKGITTTEGRPKGAIPSMSVWQAMNIPALGPARQTEEFESTMKGWGFPDSFVDIASYLPRTSDWAYEHLIRPLSSPFGAGTAALGAGGKVGKIALSGMGVGFGVPGAIEGIHKTQQPDATYEDWLNLVMNTAMATGGSYGLAGELGPKPPVSAQPRLPGMENIDFAQETPRTPFPEVDPTLPQKRAITDLQNQHEQQVLDIKMRQSEAVRNGDHATATALANELLQQQVNFSFQLNELKNPPVTEAPSFGDMSGLQQPNLNIPFRDLRGRITPRALGANEQPRPFFAETVKPPAEPSIPAAPAEDLPLQQAAEEPPPPTDADLPATVVPNGPVESAMWRSLGYTPIPGARSPEGLPIYARQQPNVPAQPPPTVPGVPRGPIPEGAIPILPGQDHVVPAELVTSDYLNQMQADGWKIVGQDKGNVIFRRDPNFIGDESGEFRPQEMMDNLRRKLRQIFGREPSPQEIEAAIREQEQSTNQIPPHPSDISVPPAGEWPPGNNLYGAPKPQPPSVMQEPGLPGLGPLPLRETPVNDLTMRSRLENIADAGNEPVQPGLFDRFVQDESGEFRPDELWNKLRARLGRLATPDELQIGRRLADFRQRLSTATPDETYGLANELHSNWRQATDAAEEYRRANPNASAEERWSTNVHSQEANAWHGLTREVEQRREAAMLEGRAAPEPIRGTVGPVEPVSPSAPSIPRGQYYIVDSGGAIVETLPTRAAAEVYLTEHPGEGLRISVLRPRQTPLSKLPPDRNPTIPKRGTVDPRRPSESKYYHVMDLGEDRWVKTTWGKQAARDYVAANPDKTLEIRPGDRPSGRADLTNTPPAPIDILKMKGLPDKAARMPPAPKNYPVETQPELPGSRLEEPAVERPFAENEEAVRASEQTEDTGFDIPTEKQPLIPGINDPHIPLSKYREMEASTSKNALGQEIDDPTSWNDFGQSVAHGAKSGKPGISVDTDRFAPNEPSRITFRDQNGVPIASARVNRLSSGKLGIGSLGSDRARGPLAQRATLEVIKKMIEIDAFRVDSSISPFTANLLTQLKRFVYDDTGAVPIKDIMEAMSKLKITVGDSVSSFFTRGPKTREFPKGTPSPFEKAIGLPTAITTTMDYSMPLRQGFLRIFTPEWRHAVKAMFEAGLSEENARAINDEIRSKPIFQSYTDANGKTIKPWAERMGMKMIEGSDVSRSEYDVASNWIEMGGKTGTGRLIRASNRAAATFLNHLRANTLENLVNGLEAISNEGLETGKMPYEGVKGMFRKAREVSTEQASSLNPYLNEPLAKEIVEFVNTATGRAPLKMRMLPFKDAPQLNMESWMGLLKYIMFSPRGLATKIRMGNPLTYTMASPFVRKQYLGAALGGAAAWASALALMKGYAAATGTDMSINLDPGDADFGKARFGNTRIDPAAGFQQILVAWYRTLAGGWKPSTGGPWRNYGEQFRAETQKDAAERFFVNKLAPVAKFAYDFWNASERQPAYLADRSLQMFVPLVMQDFVELIHANPKYLPLMAPVLFGMGSQTYDKGEAVSKLWPKQWDYGYTGGGPFNLIPALDRSGEAVR